MALLLAVEKSFVLRQCDQIGRFLKVPGENFLKKVAQMSCEL